MGLRSRGSHVQTQEWETEEGGISRRWDVVLSLYNIHFGDCKMMKLQDCFNLVIAEMDVIARLQIILRRHGPFLILSHSGLPLRPRGLIVPTPSVKEPLAACSRVVRHLQHPVVPRMFPRVR